MFAARIFCAALVCAAPVFAPPALIATVAAAAEVTTPSGLRIDDTLEGKGAPAQPGQTVTVHYTGWLYVAARRARNSTVRAIAASPSPSPSARATSSRAGTRASPICASAASAR